MTFNARFLSYAKQKGIHYTRYHPTNRQVKRLNKKARHHFKQDYPSLASGIK